MLLIIMVALHPVKACPKEEKMKKWRKQVG